MTIAFEGAADGGNNGGGTGLTFSYTVSSNSNRLLVVGFAGDTNGAADDISGVTYGGDAMSLAINWGDGTGADVNRYSYLYYLLAPKSGANNVVISASGGHYILAGAADYSGVKQTGQPDNTTRQTSSGKPGTLTTSLTTVADNCWVVLVEQNYSGNPAPVAGTGSTSRTADGSFGTYGIFDSGGAVHPAGSYSMTTTRSGGVNEISHLLASFAPATAAAATGSFFPLMRGG